MNLVSRSTVYYTIPPHQRPIKGCVIHNTVTANPATPSANGSWHFQVCRDGTVEQWVSEAFCAWHVRAADEWRPAWVERAPKNAGVSDVNWVSIGIEFVSANGHPTLKPNGYTDAQYDAGRELLAVLYREFGPLPVVGHGQLQLDRTDPVSFQWERAGLGPLTSMGRYLMDEEDEMARLTDSQREMLSLMEPPPAGLYIDASGVRRLVSDLAAVQEAEAALRKQLEEVVPTRPRLVQAVVFDDGKTQEVLPRG